MNDSDLTPTVTRPDIKVIDRSAHSFVFQVPPHHSAPYLLTTAPAPLAEGFGADCRQVRSPHVQMSPRVCTFIRRRRALSAGRCRGSSATTFQLVFITDRQPHPTVYTVGARAFPVAAARVWNSLPEHVTSAPSVAVVSMTLLYSGI